MAGQGKNHRILRRSACPTRNSCSKQKERHSNRQMAGSPEDYGLYSDLTPYITAIIKYRIHS
jgi:hypothetical protein